MYMHSHEDAEDAYPMEMHPEARSASRSAKEPSADIYAKDKLPATGRSRFGFAFEESGAAHKPGFSDGPPVPQKDLRAMLPNVHISFSREMAEHAGGAPPAYNMWGAPPSSYGEWPSHHAERLSEDGTTTIPMIRGAPLKKVGPMPPSGSREAAYPSPSGPPRGYYPPGYAPARSAEPMPGPWHSPASRSRGATRKPPGLASDYPPEALSAPPASGRVSSPAVAPSSRAPPPSRLPRAPRYQESGSHMHEEEESSRHSAPSAESEEHLHSMHRAPQPYAGHKGPMSYYPYGPYSSSESFARASYEMPGFHDPAIIGQGHIMGPPPMRPSGWPAGPYSGPSSGQYAHSRMPAWGGRPQEYSSEYSSPMYGGPYAEQSYARTAAPVAAGHAPLYRTSEPQMRSSPVSSYEMRDSASTRHASS
eukprot:TRINITY_DN662_c0_g1_i1.p1 TRINITY_DN662_c0_g1~~TRINITY_DN662_c0_g1_i1.p1  ORF type:complete len:432 (+),score=-4.50 TRINITY_DN662_c0_g1_i1:37-1296(+)